MIPSTNDLFEKAALALEKNAKTFEGLCLEKRDANAARREIARAVRPIGRSDLSKRLNKLIKLYFKGLKKNRREEKRFLKRSKRRLDKKQRGETVLYEVPKARIMDVREARREMSALIRGTADEIRGKTVAML